MAVIILAKDGIVLQRIPLIKERTTIGRRTYNDIVIDDPDVSSEHAVLVATLGDMFFQDLNSTNGSAMNGEKVQRLFLQDADVLELGRHTIQYRAFEDALPLRRPSGAAEARGRPSPMSTRPRSRDGDSSTMSSASIEIVSGHLSGRKIALTQPLVTIGRPHRHVAVLARGASGYSLTHVEGQSPPLVNGQSIGMATRPLSHNDLIELDGTQLRFSVAAASDDHRR
jgi:hypothetical protein